MQLHDLDAFTPWVQHMAYSNTKECWIAALHPGTIIESTGFDGLAALICAHASQEIVSLVADIIGVSYADIKGRKQTREVSDARHIATYIMRKDYNIPLALTAKAVGYTTHVAVYNAIRNVEQVVEVNNKLQTIYMAYPWMKGLKQRLITN